MVCHVPWLWYKYLSVILQTVATWTKDFKWKINDQRKGKARKSQDTTQIPAPVKKLTDLHVLVEATFSNTLKCMGLTMLWDWTCPPQLHRFIHLFYSFWNSKLPDFIISKLCKTELTTYIHTGKIPLSTEFLFFFYTGVPLLKNLKITGPDNS